VQEEKRPRGKDKTGSGEFLLLSYKIQRTGTTKEAYPPRLRAMMSHDLFEVSHF
jgi:hypothetical protein